MTAYINNFDQVPDSMYMSTPLISIITVTYNAQATLPPTMESVASQTFTDYEHIIVDGASTDQTVSLAVRMSTAQTRITSERDRGIYDAMNRGMGMSQGEYLIFLNAGDTFHSTETLQHIADAIISNDKPGMVYGQTILVGGPDRHVTGERHLKAPTRLTLQSFANGMLVCHQAMTVLKRIASPYDLRYRFSADYDWSIRCLQHSRHNIYLDETVIDYLDEGTTTRNHKASLKERFRIMCYYYGTVPTVLRHFKFAARNLKRKITK